MPRAERLSTRLETLLEAVFESPRDPFSLYWDIAAHIGPDEVAPAQRTIRKKLKEKEEVSPETAILVACLMNLGGFSPQRVLHFISLYIPGGIRLSLYELAVAAIFLGEPPVPSSVLYDLTQYTYLEKRLLVRKSIEISEKLSHSLEPRVLLFLYLLALRDDLSNEHVQLIALVLKRSLPSRELRGRIGSASLEEYGEIARAVRTAEERSLDLDLVAGPGTGRPSRSFSRDSASFFLDKYFSDEAIAEARASATHPPPSPPVRLRAAARMRGTAAPAGEVAPQAPMARGPAAARTRDGTMLPGDRSRARRKEAEEPAVARPRLRRLGPGGGLVALPTALAAVVLAILLGVVPAGLRSPPPSPPATANARSMSGAPAVGAASADESPASAEGELLPPSPPSTVTYVVKPGDSLWKIFTSMQARGGDLRGWREFLSRTRSVNDLRDPDQLRPGRVLTLSAPP
jgi:nucleoid-associated protein YgaU